MKKVLLVVTLLVSINSIAQDIPETTKQNELTTNLFDLVVAGSFNIGYERFFDKNQAIKVDVTFFDTYGYLDTGYIEQNNAFSVKAAYLIYFSKVKDHAGFFFYPQMKVRTGNITTNDYYYWDGTNTTNQDYTYDVGGFSAGFGIGHKWVFNDKFVLGIVGEIARDFGRSDTNDYLSIVEPRFGVNFGIRF